MALFEACSKQFVTDTGRSTLRPILDLNTSTRCNILCVVTKKRSRFFWKSDKYKATPFTLNELLTKVGEINIKAQLSFKFNMQWLAREMHPHPKYRLQNMDF